MTGHLLEDRTTLTLEELCESCGLSESTIITYISEGLIEVQGRDSRQWRFSETSIVRFQKVWRLEQDLDLNPAGAVLALDLMDQIDELKIRLRQLEH